MIAHHSDRGCPVQLRGRRPRKRLPVDRVETWCGRGKTVSAYAITDVDFTMAPPKRRVSYVIPPPVDYVPRLKLPPLAYPRHGSPRPLLFPSHHQPQVPPKCTQHRHRLGVTSLALDSTTQLQGHPSPQGILYTGSRDGRVISWDLGLSLRPRRDPSSRCSRLTRWESLTGMVDETLAEETEEEERRDGDILGDVKESGGRKRRSSIHDDIPYERQWELVPETLSFNTVRRVYIPVMSWTNQAPRTHSFDIVQKCIQIGSMTFFSATTIRPVGLSRFAVLGMLTVQCSYFRLFGWYRQSMESTRESFDGPVNHWNPLRLCPLPCFLVIYF